MEARNRVEDARAYSSSSESENCDKDFPPSREVNYETFLPDLGEKPNQPTSFNIPKQRFGIKSVAYHSFQPAWFKQWLWIS